MRVLTVLISLALVATFSSCGAKPANQGNRSPEPEASGTHPFVGFWKDGHCDDDFGLSIAASGPETYSVSFCGPGGCFEPGTYRPNTPIVGDPAYQQHARHSHP